MKDPESAPVGDDTPLIFRLCTGQSKLPFAGRIRAAADEPTQRNIGASLPVGNRCERRTYATRGDPSNLRVIRTALGGTMANASLNAMCGRPLGCKSKVENSDGRVDCDHVSGLVNAAPWPLAQMDSAIQSQTNMHAASKAERLIGFAGSSFRPIVI
jgi:hypothetical protein